jgi:hypothetical protein
MMASNDLCGGFLMILASQLSSASERAVAHRRALMQALGASPVSIDLKRGETYEQQQIVEH